MAGSIPPAEAGKLKNLVEKAGRIVITTHKSPDGDAVGSALSIHLLMKALGKDVTTVFPDEAPSFLQFLPAFNESISFEGNHETAVDVIAKADLIFSLDYNILSRLGKAMEEVVSQSKADFILIDHHQQPGNFAKAVISDTTACSTCELIYMAIEACSWMEKVDPEIAACLYCGIMTDSGSFRFPSVTADTHRIVGELIKTGMDHAEIHRQVYDTNLLDRMRLIGYALSEKLEVLEDCGTALISLSREELERFNHRQGDTEGLVNQALSIKGVVLAAFFREGNSEVKVSLRSKGSFDVNQLARKSWNGGGHMNAAGGSTQENLEEATTRFRAEALRMKNEIIGSR